MIPSRLLRRGRASSQYYGAFRNGFTRVAMVLWSREVTIIALIPRCPIVGGAAPPVRRSGPSADKDRGARGPPLGSRSNTSAPSNSFQHVNRCSKGTSPLSQAAPCVLFLIPCRRDSRRQTVRPSLPAAFHPDLQFFPRRRRTTATLTPAFPYRSTVSTMASLGGFERPPQRDSWFAPMSVDLFLKVLNVTFFHPFVAWMIPLCFRAEHMDWDKIPIRVSIWYATLVTVFWTLGQVNRRIAFGLPRNVNLEDEVIVITGGASGLGLLIAEVYGMRGASVAVLDVREMENGEARGVTYYKCDVTAKAQLARVSKQIEEDVSNWDPELKGRRSKSSDTIL